MDRPDLATSAGLMGLMSLPGIGPAKALGYARGDRAVTELNHQTLSNATADAAWQIDTYRRAGVDTLGFFDPDFPEGLRHIPAAPAVLFVRGIPASLRPPMLAVVGTRSPTTFGISATESLVAAAVEGGFGIVSGLALGIDGVAHEAALAAQGRTVAVVGSGLDEVAPRKHADLAARIVDRDGSLLSEQPFCTVPSAQTLVARNRLQAGLADALLVAQTGLVGGTMHTVRFAAEQGKRIYCPVPHTTSEASAGLDALLKTPANQLPELLPAWSRAEALAKRLGSAPIAMPVRREEADEWVASLNTEAQSGHKGALGTEAPGDADQLPLEGF